ncbi:hypothetical protein M3Y95_00914600 [Aphelenchoides besseyi]|nr:hypothetical protein M3Y95_00914600 [Aphelenchoides besseyi]
MNSSEVADLCLMAYTLHHNKPVILLLILQVVFDVLSIYMILKFYNSEFVQKVMKLMGNDLKLILLTGIFYYIYGITVTLFVYSYKLIISLMNFSPCFYVWKGLTCYLCYSQFSSAAVLGYSAFHFSLLIERIYATFYNTNRKHCSILGWILTAFMIVAPNFYIFGYSSGAYYVQDDRAYCHSLVTVSSNFNIRALYSTFLMVAFDLVVTVGDLLLLLYNRWQIARFYSKIADYNLNRSFRLREMNISMRLIFPISLAHSIGYTTQLLSVALYFIIGNVLSTEMEIFTKEIVNFIRTFSIFGLFFSVHMFGLKHRKQTAEWLQKENATESYFKEFQRIIS